MTNRIQRYAPGLRDIFDIKTGDDLIRNLLEDVRPTVDTTDVFAANRVEREGADTAAINGIGQTLSLVVPEQQLWLLYAIASQAALPDVGDAVRMSLNLVMGTESMPVLKGTTDTRVGAGQGPFEATEALTFVRPFILTAGDAVRVRIEEYLVTVAPSIQVNVRARIARFGPQSTAVFA